MVTISSNNPDSRLIRMNPSKLFRINKGYGQNQGPFRWAQQLKIVIFSKATLTILNLWRLSAWLKLHRL
jgi:hypothetical protein